MKKILKEISLFLIACIIAGLLFYSGYVVGEYQEEEPRTIILKEYFFIFSVNEWNDVFNPPKEIVDKKTCAETEMLIKECTQFYISDENGTLGIKYCDGEQTLREYLYNGGEGRTLDEAVEDGLIYYWNAKMFENGLKNE